MKSVPPKAFIFMKVGSHAGQRLEDIVAQKQGQLQTGTAFWGYRGKGPCHPITQVQAFAQEWASRLGSLHVLMAPTKVRANPKVPPSDQRSTEYSVDGEKWRELPPRVEVTGSEYALVLDEIKPVQLDLYLADFEVGVGDSKGRNAASYIRNQISRGCLVAVRPSGAGRRAQQENISAIVIQARLKPPFAVLLR